MEEAFIIRRMELAAEAGQAKRSLLKLEELLASIRQTLTEHPEGVSCSTHKQLVAIYLTPFIVIANTVKRPPEDAADDQAYLPHFTSWLRTLQ